MENVVKRLLPIFSNLPFLLPAKRAYEWGLAIEAFLYAFVALFGSSLYHVCHGFPRACLWSFFMHHVIDFWSAELVIPISALRFIKFRTPFVRTWIILTIMVIIGINVVMTDSSFLGQAFIAGICLVGVSAYILWHRIAHGYWPQYNLPELTLGVAFTIFSIAFFKTQDTWPSGYGYIHAPWHAFGAIGQYFLIGIRPPDAAIVALNSGEPGVLFVENALLPDCPASGGAGGTTFVQGFAFVTIGPYVATSGKEKQ